MRLRHLSSHVLKLLVFFSAFGVGVLGGLMYWVRARSSLSVPSFQGLAFAQAQALAVSNGMRLSRQAVVFDDEHKEGQVVRQKPLAGSRVREGRGVRVWISKGPPEKVLPDFMGLHTLRAMDHLQMLNVQADFTYACGKHQAKGVIMGQMPQPGASVQDGQVSLLVSSGRCADLYVMPDFVGWTLSAAERALNETGLVQRDVRRYVSRHGAPGQIIGQTPKPGAWIRGTDVVFLDVAQAPWHE